MSKENLEQFMVQVAESEALQTAIGEEIDAESLIALGAEHGFEFSVEDLHESAELSEDELDTVAGGFRFPGGHGSTATAYNPKYGRNMYHFTCSIGLDLPMGMP